MPESIITLAQSEAPKAKDWNPTPEQATATEERGRTLLVSAAAGSGKTRVLTERIIGMLTDKEAPANISEMLIVTFTRAAAGELRNRIAKALSKAIKTADNKEHLSKQLMLLGSASISTIDSFYYDLVRSHFQEAGFPASLRLADQNELFGLKRELMNETIDRAYAQDATFYRLADVLCEIRNESGLCNALLQIYDRLLRYPAGLRILQHSAEKLFSYRENPLTTSWGEAWRADVQEIAVAGQRVYATMYAVMEAEPEATTLRARYTNYLNERLDRFRSILTFLGENDYKNVKIALESSFEVKKPSGRLPARSPAFLEQMELCDYFFKNSYQKDVPPLCAFSEEEIKESAIETAELLTLLYKTLSDFETAFSRAKLQREVAEFTDVSRAAYRLLVNEKDGTPTPLAKEIGAKYTAIFIDEYQDVDSMQDATFSAIASPYNRFMVGDIKQSIYRFRGAQPDVFADYRRVFPVLSPHKKDEPANLPAGVAATIFMSNCFRCDKNVIDFCNAVSGDLFGAAAESIQYTRADDLVFSKTLPTPDYQGKKCRVVLIDREKAENDGSTEEKEGKASKLEALWIANEIKRLCDGEKRSDGKDITPGDIAVLMRDSKLAEHIARHLEELGIPCNDTSQKHFFENPDVLCVYSLLAALDNPLRDVYMAATLRSPFFGFTLEDLVQLHSRPKESLSLYDAVMQAANAAEQSEELSPLYERLREFRARFTLWREKAQVLPVDRLLRYLYRESAILSFAGRNAKNGAAGTQRANLQRLYEYARTFEMGGFKGLYQFVRYVDDVMENKGKMATPEGEKNAVSLITIHHSKGLEFPVCFVADTATRFKEKDLQPSFLDEEHLGCAIRLSNAGPFSRANTFFRESICSRMHRQALEEEMRILYVAMTRAKERLYITADSPFGVAHLQKRAALASMKDGYCVSAKGPAYIYWILAALHRQDHSQYATIEVVSEADVYAQKHSLLAKKENLAQERGEISSFLKERFSFRYPYAHLSKLPAKLSVSRLSPGVLDVYDSDAATPEILREEDTEQLLRSFEIAPSFLSAEQTQTAAARGTATHEFLQFCSFSLAEKNGVKNEIDRLISERFLDPAARELINEEELQRFFNSQFYRSLKTAKELQRETRFHISLRAADFTRDAEFAAALGEERLTVQGVIDLFYYDSEGKLILCDYKTDRLSPWELSSPDRPATMLSDRHAKQLSYYAKALEELCGKRPDKILIYSLPLGEAVEILV